jgi:hypothetical protein
MSNMNPSAERYLDNLGDLLTATSHEQRKVDILRECHTVGRTRRCANRASWSRVIHSR